MDTIKASLRDSKTARWIALLLISTTMFFAYFFVDVVAPFQTDMEKIYKWTPEVFGMLGGSEFFLNVFAGFLILSGIILDKMGIRFTLITAGITMVLGAFIKFYALTEGYAASGLATWMGSFWTSVPASAKLAFVGFSIFGVGVEMAGITVSKTIVKWFKGKEMALAMGLEMAIARLGVFAVFRLSPIFAEEGGPSNSVYMGLAFLMIGFITFFIYTFMDRALDKQTGETGTDPEDEFKISDIGKIFSNPGFLAIAGLCVLFYSAIFPFQKFATDMLASKLDIPIKDAAAYFSYFPIGAMILTPLIGFFLDLKGKGATLMIFGSILLTISHLLFAVIPAETFSVAIAIIIIVILGTAFSLVPASMWPSLPKIVEDRYLGSAYGAIFWIQNIGLLAVPILIGWALTTSNPGVGDRITKISEINTKLDSTQTQINKIYSDFEKNIKNYEGEIGTSISGDHKNYILINYYFDKEVKELKKATNRIEQQYAYADFRNKVLDSLQVTNNKMLKIVSDTTFKIESISKLKPELEQVQARIDELKEIKEDAKYQYSVTEFIFAGFGVLAFLLSFVLKAVDRRKGYGLDLPNKK